MALSKETGQVVAPACSVVGVLLKYLRGAIQLKAGTPGRRVESSDRSPPIAGAIVKTTMCLEKSEGARQSDGSARPQAGANTFRE